MYYQALIMCELKVCICRILRAGHGQENSVEQISNDSGSSIVVQQRRCGIINLRRRPICRFASNPSSAADVIASINYHT
jgi:uracil phosphoribosyltransferase